MQVPLGEQTSEAEQSAGLPQYAGAAASGTPPEPPVELPPVELPPVELPPVPADPSGWPEPPAPLSCCDPGGEQT